MDYCSIILEHCKNYLNKFDDFIVSKDEGGYVVESRIKDVGRYKFFLSELRGEDISEPFHVLNIVETNSPNDIINFKDHYWNSDNSIKRILKISGDSHSIIINASSKTSEVGPHYYRNNLIVIKDNIAKQYMSNNDIEIVNIDIVIGSLKAIDINHFYIGFSEHKEEKQKKIL